MTLYLDRNHGVAGNQELKGLDKIWGRLLWVPAQIVWQFSDDSTLLPFEFALCLTPKTDPAAILIIACGATLWVPRSRGTCETRSTCRNI